jgi:uroporphyrin-III C-methyltransferase/precorrin-2 dehydrogenase/sirohydrochlorin ferrochelatase
MTALDTFPVSLKVAGRRIVVVGGGLAALNKTRLVLKTSARVEVWARDFDPGFEALPQERLTLNQRVRGLDPLSVGPNWLAGAAVIFIADDGSDGEFAETEARVAGLLVNVVDRPEACDFYTPAIVDRAPISVAIASEGAAPVVARRIRAAIEAVLSPRLGALAALAGSLRTEVAARLPEGAARRHYYERLAESHEVEAALAEGEDAARQAALDLLDKAALGAEPGAIAFIGAGPGAEDLLTLRAQRLLQGADVIVHDSGISAALIEMGRRDAERIAHDPADAALPVRLAGEGRRVVRLIAGDARSSAEIGTEIAAARRAGIFTTLVPGIAQADSSVEPASLSRATAQRVA